jgi:nucleoside-diphosphate-sugar epimerase
MRTAIHYPSFPMRTIVTGASGFIGRTLCPALAAGGHEVVPVSVRSDVPRFDGAQAVVHLARADAAITRKVGREAAAAGAQLVFVSSVKVHGEESSVPLTERSMIAPCDAYAESKARAEEALRAIAGLRLAVLRPPLVYGPGVKGNFLSLMRAIDRGLPLPFSAIVNRRSLVYVGNLADAILRCAEAPQAVGRCYLVCDGAPVSTPELCRKLAAALGRPARLFRLSPALLELLPGARRLTRSLEVDDSALRRELGWHAPFTLEQGLGATADWNRRP